MDKVSLRVYPLYTYGKNTIEYDADSVLIVCNINVKQRKAIVLVDTSWSMYGTNIETAKIGIKRLVNDNCGTFETYVDSGRKRIACETYLFDIEKINVNGNGKFLEALKFIFDQKNTDVFFITDGSCSMETVVYGNMYDTLLKKKQDNNVRLYSYILDPVTNVLALERLSERYKLVTNREEFPEIISKDMDSSYIKAENVKFNIYRKENDEMKDSIITVFGDIARFENKVYNMRLDNREDDFEVDFDYQLTYNIGKDHYLIKDSTKVHIY